MLAPRQVIFTAFEGVLADPGSGSWEAAGEALAEIERRHIPLVLVTGRTRAQIEIFRRKIGHAHPFVTEQGGGLFLPDDYFAMHLEGAVRVGRYFNIAFGKPYAEVVESLEALSDEAEVEVMGYSQMTAREIAQNTGQSVKEAELDRQREFSEKFYFVGGVDAGIARFAKAARDRNWSVTTGTPFCEFWSGNNAGGALQRLMNLYRTATRNRLHSVAIGSSARDLPLLASADQAIVLPARRREPAPDGMQKLRDAVWCETPGPSGWNAAVLKILAS